MPAQFSFNAQHVVGSIGLRPAIPAANKVREEYRAFREAVQGVDVEIIFNVPAGPVPFEQTKKGTVPFSVGSEGRSVARCSVKDYAGTKIPPRPGGRDLAVSPSAPAVVDSV